MTKQGLLAIRLAKGWLSSATGKLAVGKSSLGVYYDEEMLSKSDRKSCISCSEGISKGSHSIGFFIRIVLLSITTKELSKGPSD
jgi:hypothetical protein